MLSRKVIGFWVSGLALELAVGCRSANEANTRDPPPGGSAQAIRAPGAGGVVWDSVDGTSKWIDFDSIEIAPPIRGHVISIDRSNGTVRSDFGSDEGARPGFHFDIIRSQTFIGRFRIETVFRHHSVGQVDLLLAGQRIQVGDVATNRLE